MTKNPTKRCTIYTRTACSSDGYIAQQYAACEAYARKQGWQVMPERYDDNGIGGMDFDRPAFQRLLKDAESGVMNVIVMTDITRVGRPYDPDDCYMMIDKFWKLGVEVLFAEEENIKLLPFLHIPALQQPKADRR